MKVLLACEETQAVTIEFRKLGHQAFSCDTEETSGPMPEFHIQQDCLPLLKETWDLIIAFPPCTHLSVSGARWFAEKRADGRQQEAIKFFLQFTKANANHIAIENPIGIMSTIFRKPDQIIQPWQYGHPESKRTCLWLKGLPALKPTNILKKPESGVWDNQTPTGQNKLGPSPTRAKDRSRTYPGIAKAMARQWNQYLKEKK